MPDHVFLWTCEQVGMQGLQFTCHKVSTSRSAPSAHDCCMSVCYHAEAYLEMMPCHGTMAHGFRGLAGMPDFDCSRVGDRAACHTAGMLEAPAAQHPRALPWAQTACPALAVCHIVCVIIWPEIAGMAFRNQHLS